jgi:hypothetical protein
MRGERKMAAERTLSVARINVSGASCLLQVLTSGKSTFRPGGRQERNMNVAATCGPSDGALRRQWRSKLRLIRRSFLEPGTTSGGHTDGVLVFSGMNGISLTQVKRGSIQPRVPFQAGRKIKLIALKTRRNIQPADNVRVSGRKRIATGNRRNQTVSGCEMMLWQLRRKSGFISFEGSE